MTPKDLKEIAMAIKDSQMSSFEAEIMRARIAGRIAKQLAFNFPGFDVDSFFDECGLQVQDIRLPKEH